MRCKFQFYLTLCMLMTVIPKGGTETFLIETKSAMPIKKADKTMTRRIVNMESGFMEMLFDNGHIFFNMYNYNLGNKYEASHDQIILKAKDTGSDFLLQLYMFDTGVQWTLSQIGQTIKEYKQFEKISQVKRVRGEDPWLTLGKMAGQNMIKYLSGSLPRGLL